MWTRSRAGLGGFRQGLGVSGQRQWQGRWNGGTERGKDAQFRRALWSAGKMDRPRVSRVQSPESKVQTDSRRSFPQSGPQREKHSDDDVAQLCLSYLCTQYDREVCTTVVPSRPATRACASLALLALQRLSKTRSKTRVRPQQHRRRTIDHSHLGGCVALQK